MKLTRIAARSALLLSALAAVFLAGCGQRRAYYAPVGYGAPSPVIIVHHGVGGYGGGYGAPPTVIHVYHHGGYGGYGGYGGGHTIIVHHHY